MIQIKHIPDRSIYLTHFPRISPQRPGFIVLYGTPSLPYSIRTCIWTNWIRNYLFSCMRRSNTVGMIKSYTTRRALWQNSSQTTVFDHLIQIMQRIISYHLYSYNFHHALFISYKCIHVCKCMYANPIRVQQ